MRRQLSIALMMLISCLSFGQVPAGIAKPVRQDFKVIPGARDDHDIYMAEAGDASLLFRGRSALPYSFAYNGTYYWYTPKFGNGTVRFNGKDYRNVELNIDAARQVLICGRPGTLKRSELERDQVERFTIDGTSYVNGENTGILDIPQGYFEVLREGGYMFLKQRVKTLAEDKEGARAIETDYSGVFNPYIWRIFICETDYYITDADGVAHRVRNRSDVYKVFRSHRKQLRKAVNGMEHEFIMPFEQFVMTVLDKMEETDR